MSETPAAVPVKRTITVKVPKAAVAGKEAEIKLALSPKLSPQSSLQLSRSSRPDSPKPKDIPKASLSSSGSAKKSPSSSPKKLVPPFSTPSGTPPPLSEASVHSSAPRSSTAASSVHDSPPPMPSEPSEPPLQIPPVIRAKIKPVVHPCNTCPYPAGNVQQFERVVKLDRSSFTPESRLPEAIQLRDATYLLARNFGAENPTTGRGYAIDYAKNIGYNRETRYGAAVSNSFCEQIDPTVTVGAMNRGTYRVMLTNLFAAEADNALGAPFSVRSARAKRRALLWCPTKQGTSPLCKSKGGVQAGGRYKAPTEFEREMDWLEGKNRRSGGNGGGRVDSFLLRLCRSTKTFVQGGREFVHGC